MAGLGSQPDVKRMSRSIQEILAAAWVPAQPQSASRPFVTEVRRQVELRLVSHFLYDSVVTT
eukprot:5580589-Amphidinium_carterae.1